MSSFAEEFYEVCSHLVGVGWDVAAVDCGVRRCRGCGCSNRPFVALSLDGYRQGSNLRERRFRGRVYAHSPVYGLPTTVANQTPS